MSILYYHIAHNIHILIPNLHIIFKDKLFKDSFELLNRYCRQIN